MRQSYLVSALALLASAHNVYAGLSVLERHIRQELVEEPAEEAVVIAVAVGDLEEAIYSAPEGATLVLAPGIHIVESTIAIINTITIMGGGDNSTDTIISSAVTNVFASSDVAVDLKLEGIYLEGENGRCALNNPVATATDFNVGVIVPAVSLADNKMFLELDLGAVYAGRVLDDIHVQSCGIMDNIVGNTENNAVEAISDYNMYITNACRMKVSMNVLVSRFGDCNFGITETPTATQYRAAVKAYYSEEVRYDTPGEVLDYPVERNGEAMTIVSATVSTLSVTQMGISTLPEYSLREGAMDTFGISSVEDQSFEVIGLIDNLDVPTRAELMEGGAQVSKLQVQLYVPGPCYIPSGSTGTTELVGESKGLPDQGAGSCAGRAVDLTKSSSSVANGTSFLDIQLLDSNNEVTVVKTDNNGDFVFADLALGTYTIKPPLQSGDTAASKLELVAGGPESTCQVSQGSATHIPDYYYSGEASVAGILYYGDVSRRAGYVTVSLYKDGEEIETANTDDRGVYSFTNKIDGTYEVVVPKTLMDGSPIAGSDTERKEIAIVINEVSAAVNFQYDDAPALANVGQNATYSGQLKVIKQDGADETDYVVDFLPNTDLALLGDGMTVPIVATTDASGNFLFENLAGGMYVITLPSTAGTGGEYSLVGGPSYGTPNRVVDLASGEVYTEQDAFVYSDATRISGRVLDHSGQGVEGVAMQSEANNVISSTTTTVDGFYSFSDFESGLSVVSIVAYPEGMAIANDGDATLDGQTGSVADGSNAAYLEFVIAPTNSVSGRAVSTIGGGGVPNLAVGLKDSSGAVVGAAVTDEFGGYTIPIPAGSSGAFIVAVAEYVPDAYGLVSDGDSTTGFGHDGLINVELVENENFLVHNVFYVPYGYAGQSRKDSNNQISGCLKKSNNNKGASGVQVILKNMADGSERAASTNGLGHFTFDRVRMGSFQVVVPGTSGTAVLTQQPGTNVNGAVDVTMAGGNLHVGYFGYTDELSEEGIYAAPIPGEWKLISEPCEDLTQEYCQQTVTTNIAGCDLTHAYMMASIPVECPSNTTQVNGTQVTFHITTANMCEKEELYISAGFIPQVRYTLEDFTTTAESSDFELGGTAYYEISLEPTNTGLSIADASVVGVTRTTTGDCDRYAVWAPQEGDMSTVYQEFSASEGEYPRIRVSVGLSGPMTCATPSVPAVNMAVYWTVAVEYGMAAAEGGRRRRRTISTRQTPQGDGTTYSEGDRAESELEIASRVSYSLQDLLEEESRIHKAESTGESVEVNQFEVQAALHAEENKPKANINSDYIIMYSSILTGLAMLVCCGLSTMFAVVYMRIRRNRLLKERGLPLDMKINDMGGGAFAQYEGKRMAQHASPMYMHNNAAQASAGTHRAPQTNDSQRVMLNSNAHTRDTDEDNVSNEGVTVAPIHPRFMAKSEKGSSTARLANDPMDYQSIDLPKSLPFAPVYPPSQAQKTGVSDTSDDSEDNISDAESEVARTSSFAEDHLDETSKSPEHVPSPGKIGAETHPEPSLDISNNDDAPMSFNVRKLGGGMSSSQESLNVTPRPVSGAPLPSQRPMSTGPNAYAQNGNYGSDSPASLSGAKSPFSPHDSPVQDDVSSSAGAPAAGTIIMLKKDRKSSKKSTKRKGGKDKTGTDSSNGTGTDPAFTPSSRPRGAADAI
ncbi:hypothetical protein SARC_04751 [Sphaeroforma arctica JP610]|uniref:SD-repeat containing protein B domain-containing protein n=1 Tax=Sphaeroforma arctica JP610 TaxID=667725 RepID=A0A0L0G1F3_9EUKA|nr:hypothetical protein SARC_04751 [Sphaeroforma arctica JP610]KNC82982.1 hypothetical protein SARC_04751 [Sphaeroforma arctica JP610]|eukprot:XP_014156884.1 hypothetical protein SARC_04751 [Sphaeroforma arctica JP610]